jgi:hypothetical protein
MISLKHESCNNKQKIRTNLNKMLNLNYIEGTGVINENENINLKTDTKVSKNRTGVIFKY